MDSYQLSDCKITISINWKLIHATVFLQIEFKLDSQRRKKRQKFYPCIPKASINNTSSPLVSCSFYLPRSLSL